jgi:hypothetical protein
MKEGQHYIVSLNQHAGRSEVMPYIYKLIQMAAAGVLTNPDANLLATREEINPKIVTKVISEYIIDRDNPTLVDHFAGVVNYILFIANHQNPYNHESDLLPEFERTHDEFSQEVARELWEFESRERIRSELESRATKHPNIRIIGQLAAGKTTFLKTITDVLALKQSNLGVEALEPEEELENYPDRYLQYNYIYRRNTVRGDRATLGSEHVKCFGFIPQDKELAAVSLHSAGGHIQADRINKHIKFDAAAFFVDFQSIKDLKKLTMITQPNLILSNGESVLETVLSLITRLLEWSQITGPKIEVVTKLPVGQKLTQDILDSIIKAYGNALDYARQHIKQLNDVAIYSGISIITLPTLDSLSNILNTNTLSDWRSIYNDEPIYSGSMELLSDLVALSVGNEVKPVTFGNNGDNKYIHYTEVLDELRKK